MSRAVPSAPLPLDDATAGRLLAGALDPSDAPPGYAPVVTLLAAASGPARPAEHAGAPPRPVPRPARPSTARRARRFAALVGVALVALGGVAAATTGSLPAGVQSVAHDTLGGLGVPAPPTRPAPAAAPRLRRGLTPRPAEPRRVAGRPGSPTTPPPRRVTPRTGSPVVPRRAPPTTRPRPVPGVAAPLCRAVAAGRIGPASTGRAGRAYQLLSSLAGGPANVAAYCAAVLG